MALNRTLLPIIVAFGIALTGSVSAGESASAERQFERAETLYRQLRSVDPGFGDAGSWESLAAAFAEIPERFPDHRLAGNALWRVGDIYSRRYAAGDANASTQARAAYQLLASQYPTSDLAPGAFLRMAELSPPGEGPAHYYRLMQRYPDSAEADLARQRLAAGLAVRPNLLAAAPESSAREALAPTQAPVDEVLEAAPTPASSASSREPVTPVLERVDNAEALAATGGVALEDGSLGELRGVRSFSDPSHTRIVFDLDRPVQHQIGEAQGPPRVFVDLFGAGLAPDLPRALRVDGSGVNQVRVGVNRPGVVRVVLDLEAPTAYSFFTLTDPHRLVIDVPRGDLADRMSSARRPPASAGGGEARQLNLGIRRIVIDPGHGGTAPGAIGRSGITEKELALDIARRLADSLEGSNYQVELTRDGDRSLALEERPLIATGLAADLFVSIHINSSSNRSLSGFETYYLDLATDPTAADTAARENDMAVSGVGNLEHLLDEIVKNANKRESRDLAHSIQDSLVLQLTKSHDDIRDLGVKQAPFIVLVGAEMPAVLIECSFVSNPREEERLRDPSYRQQVADAIHIGIENFAARRRMARTEAIGES